MNQLGQHQKSITQGAPVAGESKSEPVDFLRSQTVRLDGEFFNRIENCHRMPEFFISLASAGDHWMFVSSRGAVTAGRRDANHALFPYYSADKLSDLRMHAGPCTIVRALNRNKPTTIWRPFEYSPGGNSQIRQAVYKNEFGNKLWLEETHDELGLLFRYRWTFGHHFGFIRTCDLINLRNTPVDVQVLDGLLNIVPAGLDQQFQLRFSNLADAYKKNELQPDSGIGLFYLNSIPTDLAEPSEGLQATAVWQNGISDPVSLLHSGQIDQFCQSGIVNGENDIRGRRGAYLTVQSMTLEPAFGLGNSQILRSGFRWSIVANTNCESADVIRLEQLLAESPEYVAGEIEADVAENELRLLKLVSSADGRQIGRDRLKTQRHQTNVLFNIMRGGLPVNGYQISRTAFMQHVAHFNKPAFARHRDFLQNIPVVTELGDLLELLDDTNDPDLTRAGREFLPLGFSRRHGDPTRPWNEFSIEVGSDDGELEINYQGNWRDIFQNWEALACSWPDFCQSMIFRFVNASTADGYNPYRISKAGIDWETPDPEDPWSNIGYWGDHQIVYLSRLLEWSCKFNPDQLRDALDRNDCVFAEVPYRIRDAEKIRQSPRNTIAFDTQLARDITTRVQNEGADGKLLHNSAGEIVHVGFLEKLLIPALVKLTNYVPDGGIWLTTQRPEWNDANNALAGYGLSVVTVCYLNRYLRFIRNLLGSTDSESWSVSSEVVELLQCVRSILDGIPESLDGPCSPTDRRVVVDSLAAAGCKYRSKLYRQGFTGEKLDLSQQECCKFLDVAISQTRNTIRQNRRPDGLYHAYNLLDYEVPGNTDRIRHLDVMLEGQVAVLGAGILNAEEVSQMLDSLRASKLFRADQNSYMLYPNRQVRRFMEKNNVSAEGIQRSALLRKLLKSNNHLIVRQDSRGGFHFNGNFRNVNDLHQALFSLAEDNEFAELVECDRHLISELFEETFRHREFTGRSSTFFGYEGLGSIYWHMVSKLVLAIQENLLAFHDADVESETLASIRQHYNQANAGLGLNKTPDSYGAFTTDPYSHTPEHAGAQQPGMTGQVKEDILVRLTEIGVRFDQGRLRFDPCLFDWNELTADPVVFEYVDVQKRIGRLPLLKHSFGFTICQVPVVYCAGPATEMTLHFKDASPVTRKEACLTFDETRSLYSRSGQISRIEVVIPVSCKLRNLRWSSD